MARQITDCNGVTFTVDEADYDRVMTLTWRAVVRPHGHAYIMAYLKGSGAGKKRKYVILARFIVDAPAGVIVDHINRNGLDNRRANLRICDLSESNSNRGAQARNRLGLKGVSDRGNGKWRACIQAQGRRYELGRFDTAEEAARAYDAAALRLHGAFACLNYPKAA